MSRDRCRPAATILIALLVAACARAGAVQPAPADLTDVPPRIGDAPAEVVVDGTAHRIEARAWRHVPTDTSGGGLRCARLCAEIRVIAASGRAADLTVRDVYAVRADGMARFADIEVAEDGSGLTVMVEGGPETAVGTILSLVVALESGVSEPVLLRAYGVEVG